MNIADKDLNLRQGNLLDNGILMQAQLRLKHGLSAWRV